MIAVEMSPLPDKQRVIERIKALTQKQAEETANPMQEQAGQVALEQAAADVEKTRAQAAQSQSVAVKNLVEAGFQAGADPGATMEVPTTG
jgi:hypothetical protein